MVKQLILMSSSMRKLVHVCAAEPVSFLVCYYMRSLAFVKCYQQDIKCEFVLVSEKPTHAWLCRLQPRERKTDREGGCIPGGIQTAPLLCDQDGDDFIIPARVSLSLSLSFLSVSLLAVKSAMRVIYCMSSNLTYQTV